jgi:hypothetical protein
MGVFSCFWLISSAKNLKIMNLGDDQGTSGGVADILLDTDDAAVDDFYVPGIRNQARDEESDEEVDCLCLLVPWC